MSKDGSSKTDRRRFLQAIGALGVVGLAGCGGDDSDDTDTGNGNGNGGGTDTDTPTMDGTDADTPTGTDTDTPTETEPGTDTPTDTQVEQPIPDPPRQLLSFNESSSTLSAGGTVTITGEIRNPFLFPVQSVEVSLEGPSADWTVEATGDTEFAEIATGDSESVGWDITAPDGAEGSQTLTATVSYATETDEATATVETSLVVISGDITSPVEEGLITQFDASQLDADGPVSAWADVTGSGATLSQASEDAQPTLASDVAPTGESAVRFEADAGEFLTTDEPLTTATESVTIAVAFRIDDHTIPRQALAFNGTDESENGYGITVNQEGESNGTLRGLYGGKSWFPTDAAITDDDWHVVTMVIPEGGSEPGLYLDGSELEYTPQNAGATPNEPTDQFGIGQDGSDQADPPYLDGDVGEELVYERALPEGDRVSLEAYLEGKWISGE
jgi:hypothetical protein